MLAASMFGLLAGLQGPAKLTFAEIEAAKIKAYETEPAFQETSVVTILAGSDTSGTRRVAAKSGDKRYTLIEQDGEVFVEMGAVGLDSWAIFYPARAFAFAKADPEVKARPPKVDDLLQPGELSFEFGSEKPNGFRSNPLFEVLSDETEPLTGGPVRKVTARFRGVNPPREVTLVQWFHPEKWFLRRFELNGTDREGQRLRVIGEVETNFKPTLPDSLFNFDAKKVEGFKRVEMPEKPPR
jgi:hypothetical protein